VKRRISFVAANTSERCASMTIQLFRFITKLPKNCEQIVSFMYNHHRSRKR